MAEMLLGLLVDSAVSTTVDALKQMAKDEVTLLLGVADEILKLSTIFASIQTTLEEAEAKRLKGDKVNIWFENVKEVVHDIDDILDDWRTQALIESQEADNKEYSLCRNKVPNCFSPPTCFNDIMFRHNIGNRIKKARRRLFEIAEETSQLGLIALGQENVVEKTDSQIRREIINQRETSSLIDNIHSIVGRDEDKKAILEFLFKESNREVPLGSVIVGMGGLGKTTLAQLIYNDQTVESHFEKRMWVYVSEGFNVKRITKSIIESATEGAFEPLDLDPLQNCLKRLLQEKRFLLVLDDIWSAESELWEKLQFPLRAGAKGSRILITTRNETVAFAVQSTHMLKLKELPDDYCWSLFSDRALSHRDESERSELEGVGREIVRKCGGLPLAVKTIGSVMQSRTKREWELVLGSKMWNSQDLLGRIFPALYLSYYDLPPPLKQCFAYCSVYPKDSSIEKDETIKLWMAHGFIQCNESDDDMEGIGELYFEDLVRRSLMQAKEVEGVSRYKMHDAVHGVAQQVAGSECCASVVDIGKLSSSGNLRKLRHVWLDDDSSSSSVAILSKEAHKLRTFRLAGNPHKLSHLRCLRALYLVHFNGPVELLQTLGQLKHLRYLHVAADTTFSKPEQLPEEVGDCVNLQTLLVRGLRPPRQIGKLINLRHLEFSNKYSWPMGIVRLTKLRTLTNFRVGCEELKHLSNLRELSIACLENQKSVEKAKTAQMHEKEHLRALYLRCSQGNVPVAGVVEELKPHPNLEEFELDGLEGQFPSWLAHPMFPNLVRVSLSNFIGCESLPCLGNLPSLKVLDIRSIEKVTYVGSQFCGGGYDSNSNNASFPKLEQLGFFDMQNWKKWELVIPEKKKKKKGLFFPSLLDLTIGDCPELKSVRFDLLPNLQKLSLHGNQGGLLCEGPLPAHPNVRELHITQISSRKVLPDGWLGQLKALQTLYIRQCFLLTYLPNELQTLTGLQQLEISDCPLLQEQCREGGEEWHKISHIPRTKI